MALKAVKKSSKSELKERANASVNVQTKNKVIKQGIVASPEVKHPVADKKFAKVVGLSKGMTINMDNYESLRLDAWLTDEVQEGETEAQAFNRISGILTEALEKAYSEMAENK